MWLELTKKHGRGKILINMDNVVTINLRIGILPDNDTLTEIRLVDGSMLEIWEHPHAFMDKLIGGE